MDPKPKSTILSGTGGAVPVRNEKGKTILALKQSYFN
jgi:hypothetical protein